MKIILSIAVIVTLLFSGCNESSTTIEIFDLKGAWIMNKAYQGTETNHLTVVDFGANGKLKQSYWVSSDGNKSQWVEDIYDYTFDNEQLILKNESVDANVLVELELLLSSKDKLIYEVVSPQLNKGEQYELRRANVDLNKQFVSLWEGSSANVSQDLTNFRWNFKSDGTYTAHKKIDKGEWEPLEYENCTYKLVGNLLITNWISTDSDGQPITNCELWFVYIDGMRMKWMALRPFDESVSLRLVRIE